MSYNIRKNKDWRLFANLTGTPQDKNSHGVMELKKHKRKKRKRRLELSAVRRSSLILYWRPFIRRSAAPFKCHPRCHPSTGVSGRAPQRLDLHPQVRSLWSPQTFTATSVPPINPINSLSTLKIYLSIKCFMFCKQNCTKCSLSASVSY